MTTHTCRLATMALEPEELRILACIGRGMTLAACARDLEVSERTLRRRLRRLCDRLDVATSTEAVVWAAKRDYI